MITRRSAVSALLATPVLVSRVSAQAAALPVVVTFSILGDLVRQVGGDRVAVISLVGPDGDAHSYSPTPADARALAAARVIFANGLGFEGWMTRLVRSSGGRAQQVTVSSGVTPLKAEGGHSHGHGHSHGANDPHAWQDVANAKLYVKAIADGLAAADAANAGAYAARAQAYTAELDVLDKEIRARIGAVPRDQRRILTTHDAFAYFARAYEVDFLALRGVSSEAEPSPREIGAVIRQIRDRKVRALFMENISDPRAIQRIAAETGARIGGKLYSDALSPADGPAATYAAMMRHNAGQIAGALVQG
ncbi:metal ABC transporter solute-binding protein, Zn/Mn family [Phreatobacter oligotrophus]|uniref:metal ABC transporter solute-binding protein, Zn/Mn family n=1 Tax=Phreatobacter oligotrophus TaxID=1122261 RepID=UPI00235546CF|nr:zinc ABC transporter substrate-binding protein [Phreatobacter oligotrophus]MBX9990756.1 zinc ABC transporter substrate-binding protein [Phreatobacter oligotrophus]